MRRSGKKRACIVLVLGLLAALVPMQPAGAESGSVTVTATMTDTFSLTVITDGAVEFGERALGEVYTAGEQQELRVVSTRPWDFSDSSDVRLVAGTVNVPRDTVFRHTVEPTFAQSIPAGVYKVTCTYVLDLSTTEAASLPTNTPIGTHFGYSAVQR